jgi:hypothetical protein
VCLLRGTFCPHSVVMCFVWIWEQTAIISLYSINWLVFITETECVYCAVRSAHTVYLCVLCGSENKQWVFHCTALTDWFLLQSRGVFTARYELNVSIQFRLISVFKVLNKLIKNYSLAVKRFWIWLCCRYRLFFLPHLFFFFFFLLLLLLLYWFCCLWNEAVWRGKVELRLAMKAQCVLSVLYEFIDLTVGELSY